MQDPQELDAYFRERMAQWAASADAGRWARGYPVDDAGAVPAARVLPRSRARASHRTVAKSSTTAKPSIDPLPAIEVRLDADALAERLKRPDVARSLARLLLHGWSPQ